MQDYRTLAAAAYRVSVKVGHKYRQLKAAEFVGCLLRATGTPAAHVSVVQAGGHTGGATNQSLSLHG